MTTKNSTARYRKADEWYEPAEILTGIRDACEMSKSDHGFLCGLIRQFRPRKILELGVAEGGTTAVIMNALKCADCRSTVYSVDLREKFYKDPSRETGYVYHDLKERITGGSTHRFLLGKALPEVIGQIGDSIDFAILDTTHQLPGEILDFLCLLPFMKEHGVIVLHDIGVYYGSYFSDELYRVAHTRIATKILFDVVKGRKYYNACPGDIPNIGAFQTGADAWESVTDVFSSLMLSWSYLPDVGAYKKIYEKYYDESCLELFDIAVDMNRRMSQEKLAREQMEISRQRLKETVSKAERVYIYSTGAGAARLKRWLDECELPIHAFIISDSHFTEETFMGTRVMKATEYECAARDLVIMGAKRPDVKQAALDYGISCVELDRGAELYLKQRYRD